MIGFAVALTGSLVAAGALAFLLTLAQLVIWQLPLLD